MSDRNRIRAKKAAAKAANRTKDHHVPVDEEGRKARIAEATRRRIQREEEARIEREANFRRQYAAARRNYSPRISALAGLVAYL